jgi:hypothetical protein
LHEPAISEPVRAGYGTLVLCERALARAGRPIERLGWPGRIWTLGWLALPLPLLFHLPFVRGVVWPVLGIVPGAALS